jgi:2-amino-4-hydroxy-6-hydroxymethyldihydropteridine diphosphokinase
VSRAVLALGSNLGDRLGHLRSAVAGLGDAVLTVSGVYETAPWGDADQPTYYNAVLIALAELSPRGWWSVAVALETEAGRVRDPARRFGPRSLDVDVIGVWADDGEPIVSGDPELTLPHPRAHLRAFVLRPWLDVEPYARVPGHGYVNDLLRTDAVAPDLAGVIARPDLDLSPDEPGGSLDLDAYQDR